MVAIDLYVTETTRHADYILPATTFLEREDFPAAFLTFSLTPYVQWTNPVAWSRGARPARNGRSSTRSRAGSGSRRRASGSYGRSAGSGFTSVAPGCVISGSEIEYSIVMRGASIQGVRRIEASLIGHDVEVTPSPRVPKAHRLVLGDNSKVQISS